MVFVSELSRKHLGKVIKDALDYAISNTGIKSLSVETPENINMPNKGNWGGGLSPLCAKQRPPLS